MQAVSNNKMKITMTKNRALPMIAALLLLAIATQSSQLTRRALQEADCNGPQGSVCTYDIPNCAAYNAECQCTQCSSNACLNSQTNECEADDHCAEHTCCDTGLTCTGCYDGWQLEDGVCIETPPGDTPCDDPPSDCAYDQPNCAAYNDQCQCTQCSSNACLNSQTNECEADDHCAEHTCCDTGLTCTGCYDGWQLEDGVCIETPPGDTPCDDPPSDCAYDQPNCAAYNDQCQCTQCSSNACLNSQTNECEADDHCAEHTCCDTGLTCTGCYDGWQLEDGVCIETPPGDTPCDDPPSDCAYDQPNCAAYNDQCQCIQCSSNACLNSQTNECEADDHCAEHTCCDTGFTCTGCYDGWQLVDGECVEAPGDNGCDDPPGGCTNNDPYCHTFNYDGCFCQVCSFRTCLNFETNLCQPVSDHCKQWGCGENGGFCTCCYWGYKVVDGECVLA